LILVDKREQALRQGPGYQGKDDEPADVDLDCETEDLE
jgi:hypothetical protein